MVYMDARRESWEGIQDLVDGYKYLGKILVRISSIYIPMPYSSCEHLIDPDALKTVVPKSTCIPNPRRIERLTGFQPQGQAPSGNFFKDVSGCCGLLMRCYIYTQVNI